MQDLSRRSTQAEVMDDETTNPEDYARCLADLETLNRLTLTHRPTLRWLDAATRGIPAGAVVSVLDIASGHGDLLRAIDRWAKRRGLRPRLTGIDLNRRSGVAAAAATPADVEIAWVQGNVFDYEPQPRPDFIVSSQFTHHLDDDQVVAFLRWLEGHAMRGWSWRICTVMPFPITAFACSHGSPDGTALCAMTEPSRSRAASGARIGSA